MLQEKIATQLEQDELFVLRQTLTDQRFKLRFRYSNGDSPLTFVDPVWKEVDKLLIQAGQLVFEAQEKIRKFEKERNK